VRITIGVPVFNGSLHLESALKSVLSSAPSDARVVVSDNASSDGSAEIARAIEDPRVEVRQRLTQVPAEYNFYEPLMQAKTPYFMWAADDDFWHPDFVEAMLQNLSTSAECMYAMSAQRIASRKGLMYGNWEAHDLRLVEISDSDARFKQYASTHWLSHKDNLVYAVWNTQFLQQICSEIFAANGSPITNEIMNLVAVYRAPGAWSDQPYFQKLYDNVAPGGAFDSSKRFVNSIARSLHLISGGEAARQRQKEDLDRNLQILSALRIPRHLVDYYEASQRQMLFAFRF
jgi:glycosyltransferase involved in cell wall biosynthesis